MTSVRLTAQAGINARKVLAESKALRQTEAAFQDAVIELARLHGWKVSHARPAWTAKGYRTAIQGDKGAPDLLLARRGFVLHVELKSDRKDSKLTAEQAEWRDALGDSWRLWRPADWAELADELA